MTTLQSLTTPCIGTPTLDLAWVPPLKGGCTPDARCSVASSLARQGCKVSADENTPTTSHAIKLPADKKRRIEQSARRAAKDGRTRDDACPWMYASQEGQHWTAVFLLAGGKLK